MCVKSRGHCCTQSILLILLVISFVLFTGFVVCNVGAYLLTAPEEQSGDLITAAAGEGPDDVSDDVEVFEDKSKSIGPEWVLKSNCSWIQTQIDTGKLFGLCEEANDDSSKLECFRNSVLYTGLLFIAPMLLTLMSIISVCRLALCPVIFFGLVYLALAVAILLLSCLYHDSVILNALSVSGTLTPLAIQLVALVVLYIVLALLMILLFSFVVCERRRAGPGAKSLKHSTSDDENGLDIDDPRAPLYGYSSRPGGGFDDRVKDFKYIDDDMSYILKK